MPASGPRSPEKAPAEAPAGALPPLPGVAPGHPGSAVDLLSGNGSTPLLLACGMGHLGAAAALVKVRDVWKQSGKLKRNMVECHGKAL